MILEVVWPYSFNELANESIIFIQFFLDIEEGFNRRGNTWRRIDFVEEVNREMLAKMGEAIKIRKYRLNLV